MKKITQRLAALFALALASISSAMAAVPTEVTTALDEAKTDGSTIAGAILAVVIIIAALKLARRAA